jgi:hypothetical protein
VVGKRVLRRIFRPLRNEVTVGWRKLQNEELLNLYYSPSLIRRFKSRKMRCARHAARMGKGGRHIGCWWESQRERGH